MSEYKRLTDRDVTKVCFDTWELCGLDKVCKRDCRKPEPCKIPQMILRLAKLEDKIENKTLVEMPCKIGDTIYHVNLFASTPVIEEYIVTGIRSYANELLHKISTQIECYPVKDGPCSFGKYTFNDSDIFTSKVKAKQELEKLLND